MTAITDDDKFISTNIQERDVVAFCTYHHMMKGDLDAIFDTKSDVDLSKEAQSHYPMFKMFNELDEGRYDKENALELLSGLIERLF